MMSFFALVVASALFLQAHASPVAVPVIDGRAEQAQCGFSTVPLLCAYSSAATDHFYTTNAAEWENAVVSDGYESEADAAQVFSTQVPDSVALHRLWSAQGGDHFYTTSVSERDSAVDSTAYVYEGITAYVYPSIQCGAVPLYRVSNPIVADHFYTTRATERDDAISNFGYVDEGIAAYVNAQ